MEGDIAAQTARVLENLKAVLEACGSGLASVVKTTVYMKDMGEFAQDERDVWELLFGKSAGAVDDRSGEAAARCASRDRCHRDCGVICADASTRRYPPFLFASIRDSFAAQTVLSYEPGKKRLGRE